MESNARRNGAYHPPHAIERLWLHYGIRMSVSDLRMIRGKIVRSLAGHEEKVFPVMQLDSDASLWLVKYKGHWYPAVWDDKAEEIKTFLPKDAYDLRSPNR